MASSKIATLERRATDRRRPANLEEQIARIAADAETEMRRSMDLHTRRFSSPHEGWGLLYEEVDELWDEVRAYPARSTTEKMRTEAIQAAAMAMRFVLDVCDSE